MSTEDPAHLATLIRADYFVMAPNHRVAILAALALAPVGRAAIAYHDAAGGDTWSAARRLDAAIEVYKRTLK